MYQYFSNNFQRYPKQKRFMSKPLGSFWSTITIFWTVIFMETAQNTSDRKLKHFKQTTKNTSDKINTLLRTYQHFKNKINIIPMVTIFKSYFINKTHKIFIKSWRSINWWNNILNHIVIAVRFGNFKFSVPRVIHYLD